MTRHGALLLAVLLAGHTLPGVTGVVPEAAAAPPCADQDGDIACDAADNCPSASNPDQADSDRDGVGDVCDPCNDNDGDGLGNACDAGNCGADNCKDASNPGQEDLDADGLGDACDVCPSDALNDEDRDGLCAGADNCPATYNPDQRDSDGDGHADACDICPSVPDPGQEDRDGDGSGDACQPHLAVWRIQEDGGDELEVGAATHDPQADALTGSLEVHLGGIVSFTIPNEAQPFSCFKGYFPDDDQGEGIAYHVSISGSFLFDVGTLFGCGADPEPRFLFARGACEAPDSTFELIAFLDGLALPAPFCVRKATPAGEELYDLRIASFDQSGLSGTLRRNAPVLLFGPGPWPPPPQDISGLQTGAIHRILVGVMDGSSLPSIAEAVFLHQEETSLVVTEGPLAMIRAPAAAECDRTPPGLIPLDGTGSAAPPPVGGPAPALASFEWFRDFGLPTQETLGNDPLESVFLPVGNQEVTLRVTDTLGRSDTARTAIVVADTRPPAIAIGGVPPGLWPPNHRLVPIRPAPAAADACDPNPSISLLSATSSEPADQDGDDDGNTSVDILSADLGLPDTAIVLRAERSRTGVGRIYEMVYEVRDASGHSAVAAPRVAVPVGDGSGPEPLLLSVRIDAATRAIVIDWSAVPGADSYDLIRGRLEDVSLLPDLLSLGHVAVPARETTATSWLEESGGDPDAGRAYFYLVQSRDATGSSGYGTESAPWPREPSSCDGGCP